MRRTRRPPGGISPAAQAQAAAVHHLSQDPVFRTVLERVAAPRSSALVGNDFEMACRIIAGQQLSTKAAATIWSRVRTQHPSWQAEIVAASTHDQLRACGLSGAKSSAIRTMAERVASRALDFRAIRRLGDAEAAAALAGIKGFGPWSVEMFLIFALGRPDVFSGGDAGLRQAICELDRVPRHLYESRAPSISARWQPWRSIACRYLWAWLDTRR